MDQEPNIKQSGYSLTKTWFEFVLENPDKVSGNHTALYLWIVQINNRKNWIEVFGVTVSENMDGMSCKSRTTYYKVFKDLIEWGFIRIVIPAENQYKCNMITLPNIGTPIFGTPNNEQSRTKNWSNTRSSTRSSTGTILKQVNKETDEVDKPAKSAAASLPFISISAAASFLDFSSDEFAIHAIRQTKSSLDQLRISSEDFIKEQQAVGKQSWKDVPDLRKHFINWCNKKQEISKRDNPAPATKAKAQLSDSQKRQLEEAYENQTLKN